MSGALDGDDLGGGRGLRGGPGGSRRSTGSRCPGWPPRRQGRWNPTPAASCRPSASRATTALTASKFRSGRPRPPTGAANTSTSSSETPRRDGRPHAAFHRIEGHRITVSNPRDPCRACKVITLAITSAGTLGRPRREGTDRQTSPRETTRRDARPETQTCCGLQQDARPPTPHPTIHADHQHDPASTKSSRKSQDNRRRDAD